MEPNQAARGHMSAKTPIAASELSVANIILCGDAAQKLKLLPDDLVDCIVTSPPYFRQRDYEIEGQIGSETAPSEYVGRLMAILSECYRVLKPTGTLWLNIGDKYDAGRLLGIPWRVAIAMQDAGWMLRSDIIWHKTNAMPHSTKSRPTTDHEYLFLFSKNGSYYYDADAIREPHVTFSEHSKMRGGRNHFGKAGGTPERGKNGGNQNLHDARWDQAFHPLGRNKRTVWSLPLGKYRGAHFAVFPEKLVEPCILAGSPANGLVLDPFLGAGTVALVASRLNRRFIGVELNPKYVALARERLGEVQPELFSCPPKAKAAKTGRSRRNSPASNGLTRSI